MGINKKRDEYIIDQETTEERGNFGAKTFATFCYEIKTGKKKGAFMIEATCLNYDHKILVPYDDELPEIQNHKNAVKELIKKFDLEINKKGLTGLPVLAKDIDFIFYEQIAMENTKLYNFKI
jgi:hypothetical protein